MKTVKKLSFLLAILMMVSCVVPFAAVADGESVTTVGYSAARVVPVEITEDFKNLNGLVAADVDSNTNFFIQDADGLMNFATLVNGGKNFLDKNVYLIADLDMSGKTWIPIGAKTGWGQVFRGTFDGQGHIIDNLNAVTAGAPASNVRVLGLFGACFGATVKNVIIGSGSVFKYSETTADARVGSIVGAALGTCETVVDNCYNQADVSMATVGNTLGGLVGHASKTGDMTTTNILTVKNSTNAGDVTSPKVYVGGIIAYTDYYVSILNCRNVGDVTANDYAGGMIGLTNNAGKATITGCINNGTITANGTAGGIAAWFNTSGRAEITYCANYGVVNANNFKADMIARPHTNTAILITTNNKTDVAGTVDPTLATDVTYPVPSFEKAWAHGYQLENVATGAANRSIRLVGSIDSKDYQKVGYRITVTYGENGVQTFDKGCAYVYESLTAMKYLNEEQGEDPVIAYTATDLRGEGSYLYALTLQNIPTDLGELTITVQPYCVDMEGNEIEGRISTFTCDLSTTSSEDLSKK